VRVKDRDIITAAQYYYGKKASPSMNAITIPQ